LLTAARARSSRVLKAALKGLAESATKKPVSSGKLEAQVFRHYIPLNVPACTDGAYNEVTGRGGVDKRLH
jgi:hypothetical protein